MANEKIVTADEDIELVFEANTGRKSSRRAKYSMEKMRELLVKATNTLVMNDKQAAELEKKLKETKTEATKSKLIAQIHELKAGVKIKFALLEKFMGHELSSANSFVWFFNPKNSRNVYQPIVDEFVAGKMRVGASNAKDPDKNKQEVRFELIRK